MMRTIEISKKRARRIAVHASLLPPTKLRAQGKKGVLRIVDSLGYIQIDSISVVERAHHQTLWSRQADYRHDYLETLLARDRQVFEYWGHAASILPMKDYRFYLPYMKKCRNPGSAWARKRKKKCEHLIDDVYRRIKEEGPMGSRNFNPEPDTKRNAWWDWKPAKIALELLFSEGRLMVSSRKGFQRLYDLAERVLPDDIDRTYPTDEETGQFFVKRALKSYGIATVNEICEHIKSGDKKNITMALWNMTDSREVIPVKIQSLEKETYFMLRDFSNRLLKLRKPAARLQLLSPFDNLVIQRDRIERLFDFSYRLECYVPAAKRKYGYFSLPLLFNERLIGRMDSKVDRKNKTLFVRNLVFEENFKDMESLLPYLADELKRFLSINGCKSLIIEKVNSAAVRRYF